MAGALLAGSALLILASGGTRIAVAAFRPTTSPSEGAAISSNSVTNLSELAMVNHGSSHTNSPQTAAAPANLPQRNPEVNVRAEVATHIANGKFSYETGDLEAARAHLNKALTIEPGNTAAQFYFNLATNRMVNGQSPDSDGIIRTNFPISIPASAAQSRQIIQPSSARREIMTKLQNLRIDQPPYEAKPLSEVIWDLQQKTREADPEGKGINFIVSLSEVPLLPRINPATGLPEAITQTTSTDLKSVLVTTRPARSNVPVDHVLNAVVAATSNRIKWSIMDFGILVSPKGEEASPLHARTFRVNWTTFTNALYAETRATELTSAGGVSSAFYKALANRGITLTNVFCNPAGETIMMQGTVAELEAAGKLLNEFTHVPSQVHARTKFISVPENRLDELLAILGETNTANAQSLSVILKEADFKSKMRALETIPGVAILNEGNVTTLSGRQAQIQAIDLKTMVVGINPKALNPPGIVSSNGTNDLLQTQVFPFGPTINIVASASDDRKSISLHASATLAEFLGYQKTSNTTAYVDGVRTNVAMPLPKFRIVQASAEAKIWDGQTLVMVSGPKRTVTGVHEPKEMGARDQKNHRLITFVTSTLIDAAGNRLNPPK